MARRDRASQTRASMNRRFSNRERRKNLTGVINNFPTQIPFHIITRHHFITYLRYPEWVFQRLPSIVPCVIQAGLGAVPNAHLHQFIIQIRPQDLPCSGGGAIQIDEFPPSHAFQSPLTIIRSPSFQGTLPPSDTLSLDQSLSIGKAFLSSKRLAPVLTQYRAL